MNSTTLKVVEGWGELMKIMKSKIASMEMEKAKV